MLLHGTVSRMPQQHQGWIRCDETNTDIWFSTYRQSYTVRSGDRVQFSVAFNYGGPFAMRLERL
jgi:hypothetical protein